MESVADGGAPTVLFTVYLVDGRMLTAPSVSGLQRMLDRPRLLLSVTIQELSLMVRQACVLLLVKLKRKCVVKRCDHG